jgi:hypothetical protein
MMDVKQILYGIAIRLRLIWNIKVNIACHNRNFLKSL